MTEAYLDEPFERCLTRIYHDSKENGAAVLQHLEGVRSGGYQGRSLFDLITHPKLLDGVSDPVGPEIVASAACQIGPKIPGVGRDAFTKGTLRFAWHITTIAWFGFAVVLVDGFARRSASLRIVSMTFLAIGLVALVASRGRHLAWIVFLAVAAVTWFAA